MFGRALGAIASHWGVLAFGMVAGVILERKTGLISKGLVLTVGKIPVVGPAVLG